MRIKDLYIDGFGRFADVSLTDLPLGLSIILGDNEAGKTTLLAFVRSVLFGLPTRNQAKYYPPVRGGRKGGRLVLVNGQQESITVERYAGRGSGQLSVQLPDGQMGSEEDLRQLLGSATSDLYESVFAFGLTELQTFDSLNEDKVRDAIYSAGAGVGQRSITEVTKELEKQISGIYTPRAKNAAIPQLLKKLEEIASDIREHTKDPDEFERLHKHLESVEEQLANVDSELSTSRRELDHIRRLQQGWEPWTKLVAIRDRLADLPKIDSFPENGVSRLETLQTELRNLRDEREEVAADLETARSERSQLDIDASLLAASDDINTLDRDAQLFRQQCHDHLESIANLSAAEKKLQQTLKDLGGDWNEDRLASLDLSLPIREQIESLRRDFETAKSEARDRQADYERETERVNELEARKTEAEAALNAFPEPSASIDAEAIRQLSLGRGSYENARRDLPTVASQCETETAHLQDTLQKIGRDWTEDKLTGFDTSIAVQEQIHAHQMRLTDCQTQISVARQRVEDARQTIHDTMADLERTEQRLAELPVPSIDDENELTQRRRSLQTMRTQLADAVRLKTRQEHVDERRRDLTGQVTRLREDARIETSDQAVGLIAVLVAAGVIALLVFGLARHDWPTGAIVGTLFVGVAAYSFWTRRKQAAGQTDRQRRHERELADLQTELQHAENEGCVLEQDLKHLNQLIHDTATQCNVAGTPDTRTIGDAEAMIEQQLERIRQRRPLMEKRKDLRQQLEKANETLNRNQQIVDRQAAVANQATNEWQSWLAETDLPETLSPDSASNVLLQLDTAREKLKGIQAIRLRCDEMKAAIRDYEDHVRAVATACELAEDWPDDAGAIVDTLQTRCHEHMELADARAESSRRLADVIQQWEEAGEKAAKAERAYQTAADAEADCRKRWIDLLRRVKLRDSLSTDQIRPVLEAIDRCRDQLTLVEELRNTERDLQSCLERYRVRVEQTAEMLNRPFDATSDVLSFVASLNQELESTQTNQNRAAHLDETIGKADERLTRCHRRIEERDREMKLLFEAAGTENEEAFRKAATIHDERQRLEDQSRQLLTQLKQLVGSGEATRTFERELASIDTSELALRRTELEARITELESEKTETADERGRLKGQLEQLENSDELSRLRIEEQSLRAELQSEAREWAVLKLTQSLIEQAKEKYERERRPAVLKEAERYFSHLTGERYAEIRASLEGRQVEVRDIDGQLKSCDQLSRGTAEQLYLALRFGFIREFQRQSEPLPLVFDDVLVNFDPTRARATAELIHELAQSLQCLLFTCHPTTVDLLRQVDADARVFALNDGQF